MVGNGKRSWLFSFTRSGASKSGESTAKTSQVDPPPEFLCPILGSLMSDPVVVSSGQTFERVTVQACKDLGFSPVLDDGSRPDFSAVFPNLALQKTICNWCVKFGAVSPPAPDYTSTVSLIRAKLPQQLNVSIRPSERELLRGVANNSPLLFPHAVSEVAQRVNHFHSTRSEAAMAVDGPAASPEIPLPLTIRPLCYSSSRSSIDYLPDEETLGASEPASVNHNPQEEELISKLTSEEISEQENGAILLRKITRTKPESRSSLCTPRLIASLKPFLASRQSSIQVNAVASVVNLSLEKPNKVKILRSGVVPLLIDVLKGDSTESQEHAAGALFSLSLEDDNKMAIGVLGALSPLLDALRSDSDRTRQDCALALYNLTLVQGNKIKLIKLNAIPVLLEMVKSGDLASRVLLILCNLAACVEGRSAMMDLDAVGILVGLLRGNHSRSRAAADTVESCVGTLYALSHGSLRFKGLAMDARAIEVLREVEERGTDRAREKARRLLELMKSGEAREEEDLYQAFPVESDPMVYRGRYRIGPPGGGRGRMDLQNAYSTDF
ncbi:hypothetical protein SAY87_010643 [Trapa incisa]|uniref:RING-type E3 ubiquitin transferase n=1 Tax=Trapa incisa TaxID=236973 RepID=A0AAN7GI29_9MYRT|nr:hypothetical protein SAY87_010643 [Trapa incisa]